MREYYQPFPFKDFEVSHTCKNCEERYQAIKKDYGDFSGKFMADFFAANCYFGFRFLQDGGKEVMAVEKDAELAKEVEGIAKNKGLLLHCTPYLDLQEFDIALILDSLGYADSWKYLELMRKKCKVTYVSAPDPKTEEKMLPVLQGKFKTVTPVFKDKQTIYRCSN